MSVSVWVFDVADLGETHRDVFTTTFSYNLVHTACPRDPGEIINCTVEDLHVVPI